MTDDESMTACSTSRKLYLRLEEDRASDDDVNLINTIAAVGVDQEGPGRGSQGRA